MRILYKKALEIENYSVRIVGTGQDALNFFETQPLPGILILDMNLPDMSGTDLLKMIRSHPQWKSVKVILVSGKDNLKSHALEMGAEGYLKKPFELASLYSEIEKYF